MKSGIEKCQLATLIHTTLKPSLTVTCSTPDGTFKLTSVTNSASKLRHLTTWHANGMFRYMFKAEFVTLVGLRVPSGWHIHYRTVLA